MRDDALLAIDLGRQQLVIDREVGNPRDEAITLGNLGSSLLSFGRNAEAAQHSTAGLRLARAVGDREAEVVPLHNLSILALRDGRDAQALGHAQSALDVAVEIANPPLELLALLALARAELALGRHAAATAAFDRAHAKALALQREGLAYALSMQHEALAGLAQVAWAQGNVDRASVHVAQLLSYLGDCDTLPSSEDPFLIALTCYQVLTGTGDARAVHLLEVAHHALQAKAQAVPDAALRHSFLNDIPEHREIVAAWRAQNAGAAGLTTSG
jgi:tetratricopeptide (TPR) repeat protein